MPNAARLTDAVDGTTAGEHSGHVPPHSPEPFTGEISGACSGNVPDQRTGGRHGGQHHHRAGRVLWVQPGRGGGRQRDGADQRESGGQNRRRPGAP